MSNARYIELDSSFRDRNLWPDPSEFEAPIAQSGRNNTIQTAINPVSDNAPKKQWTSNGFSNPGGPSITGSVNLSATGGIGSLTGNQIFIMDVVGIPQQESNYYSFAVIHNTTTGQESGVLVSKYIGIVLGVHRLMIGTTTPFTPLSNGDAVTIIDPTQLDISMNGILFANPKIFVPSGPLNPDAYPHHVVLNETQGESRPILSYDFKTHLVSLVTTGSAVPTSNSGPVGPGASTWNPNDNYSIRRIAPRVFINNGLPGLVNQVTLTGGSSIDEYYTGQYIRIQAGTLPAQRYITNVYPELVYGVPPVNEVRRIQSYDGITNIATVNPPFSAVPLSGENIEMLQFTCDSFNPFVYTGSMVSQQEIVCYEIELLNLVLPNLVLANSGGGQVSFHQYVYVELSNVSSAGGVTPHSIYSNNPNSVRMTFRAAIDDIPNPTLSSFIKIDGDGMVQTLKFKPNDNLKFSVRMQNGSLFKTVQEDTKPPFEVNALVQISAMFSIRRL